MQTQRKPNPGVTAGIDIGGANLKLALLPAIDQNRIGSPSQRSLACARSVLFPMWTDADRLSQVIQNQLIQLRQKTINSNKRPGAIDSLAVTMTGEMADCFLDRREGVSRIAKAVSDACECLNIQQIGFYGCQGRFLQSQEVESHADLIASANWHAAASWAAKEHDVDVGVFIDVGSTTTDLIPLRNGRIGTNAQTDHERLCEGSLIYLGCDRTPVCSLVSSLKVGDKICPVVNEVFATMADVLTLLGLTDEHPDCCVTADGQPRTVSASANRVSRMVGLDRATASVALATDLAKQIFQVTVEQIQMGVSKVDAGGQIIVAGHGSGLLKLPTNRNVMDLSQSLGKELSRCLPAYAVARLFQDSVVPGRTVET